MQKKKKQEWQVIKRLHCVFVFYYECQPCQNYHVADFTLQEMFCCVIRLFPVWKLRVDGFLWIPGIKQIEGGGGESQWSSVGWRNMRLS